MERKQRAGVLCALQGLRADHPENTCKLMWRREQNYASIERWKRSPETLRYPKILQSKRLLA